MSEENEVVEVEREREKAQNTGEVQDASLSSISKKNIEKQSLDYLFIRSMYSIVSIMFDNV